MPKQQENSALCAGAVYNDNPCADQDKRYAVLPLPDVFVQKQGGEQGAGYWDNKVIHADPAQGVIAKQHGPDGKGQR